ncbi:TonB-dependent receptor [Sphingomonas hengshuiensis]|uniref:TonB-dependent receptor n=2 Tax=Sphingomonas hengshuiensis TaxID=1609977 RepID=A0A7U5BGE2_9SPHN|nr:TonB-dependent receptor [Sphingomonas hengshuiensis]
MIGFSNAKLALAGASAMIALATSGMAFAQEANQAPAEAQDSGGLTDIVVTAQRRPEKLQEVPIAVTAFTEMTIRDFNLNDAISVSKYVPSMISAHNAGLQSANAYYMRGLGNSQSVATFDPPVGTYVDDVYIARQNANNYAFFDTERVEVLRGPQGTLFGRNTTGGAISVIMRKPGDEYKFKGELSAGSYGRITGKAIVDVPLSEKVLTKISAFYVKDDGYLQNVATKETLNGERNYGIRSDIRFLASEAFTFDVAAEYTNNTGTYLGPSSLAVRSERYKAATTPILNRTNLTLPKTDCKGDSTVVLLTRKAGLCALSENYAVTANANYETDGGTLTGIFGWRRLTQGWINQYNTNGTAIYNSYIIADNSTNEQVSGELKWNSTLLDGRLNYTAGLFYLHEDNEEAQADFQDTNPNATAFKLLQDRNFAQKVETMAAYLQADYSVTNALTFTLGGRFTHETRKLAFFDSVRFPGFGFDSADAIAAGIPLKLTQNRFTPRVAVNYKLDPNVMVYASVTNGFKSGGWNGNAATPARVLPFRPEITWSYEGGVKSELFNRRLRINLTGYLADTKDIQITSGIIPPGETTIVSLARNAGTLRTYGLEWETALAVNRNFNLFVNGSLNHGEYTSITLTPGVAASLQVQLTTEPVRVPTFQLASGGTYKVPVDALGGDVGLTAAYRHNSPYWISLLNTARAPIENYVDLTLTYDRDDGKWGASFGVTNLTKQETITANFLALFPGDPRRFTGKLWFNF